MSTAVRVSVIQPLVSLFETPRYLEIGVHSGETFFSIEAFHKVAVDPNFRFDTKEASITHPNARFHNITSDVFFEALGKDRQEFDVIFLDGLHTFEQTLRDFTNAMAFLSERGVIIIDDVVPNSYEASLPNAGIARDFRAKRGIADQSWMGDVYRLIYFIDAFFQQWTVRTVQNRCIVWRQTRYAKAIRQRKVMDIAALPFEAVYLDSGCYHRATMESVLNELRARGLS